MTIFWKVSEKERKKKKKKEKVQRTNPDLVFGEIGTEVADDVGMFEFGQEVDLINVGPLLFLCGVLDLLDGRVLALCQLDPVELPLDLLGSQHRSIRSVIIIISIISIIIMNVRRRKEKKEKERRKTDP